MPKKSRTPPPPRRPVQAPRKRSGTGGRSGSGGGGSRRRTWLWAGALAGVLVVAGAAVGIALAVGGGDPGESAAPGAGGCVMKTYPSQGRQHTPPYKVPASFKYNSMPPTSGPHDPSPAIWDVYEEPVGELHLIHNLEHGGIVVQYGSGVPQAEIEKILAWYRDDPDGLIVAPYPKLGAKIAVSAWTHLLTCSAFEDSPFSDFRDAYRYKGPETGFSSDYYQPGNG